MDWKLITAWLSGRLNEPSTWAGVAVSALAGSHYFHFSPTDVKNLTDALTMVFNELWQVFVALSGVAAILMKERNTSAPSNPPINSTPAANIT